MTGQLPRARPLFLTPPKLKGELQMRTLAQNYSSSIAKTNLLPPHLVPSAQSDLGIPLPEMIFGHNHLTLEHKHGFRLEFRALDALRRVDSTSESSEMIKVAYAEEWTSKR